jgi:hypothetical protein
MLPSAHRRCNFSWQATARRGSAICLLQHPDEHRPQGPILLAVDQQLGEGAFAALTDSTYGTVTFSVSTPVFVSLNLPSNDRMCWPADSGSRT